MKKIILWIISMIILMVSVAGQECGGLNVSSSNRIESGESFTLNESCYLNLTAGATIFLGDNLIFDGGGYTLYSDYDYYQPASTGETMFYLDAPNVELRNVKIENAPYAIARNLTSPIWNITIDNVETNSYVDIRGVNDTVITNCNFHDTILSSVSNSIVIILYYVDGVNLIENNTFYNIGNQTYYQIASGTYYNRHNALNFYSLADSGSENTVRNNIFENITLNAVYVDINTNTTIQNNDFNNVLGVQIMGSGLFEDNHFRGNSPAMLFASGAMVGAPSPRTYGNLVVRYNTFDDMSRGLHIRNTENKIVYGNNITNLYNPNASYHSFDGQGIYVRSASANNLIYNNLVLGENLTGNVVAVKFDLDTLNNLFYDNAIYFTTINASNYKNVVENNSYLGVSTDELDVLNVQATQIEGEIYNLTWDLPVLNFHTGIMLEYSTDLDTWTEIINKSNTDAYHEWNVTSEGVYYVRAVAFDTDGFSDRYQLESNTVLNYSTYVPPVIPPPSGGGGGSSAVVTEPVVEETLAPPKLFSYDWFLAMLNDDTLVELRPVGFAIQGFSIADMGVSGSMLDYESIRDSLMFYLFGATISMVLFLFAFPKFAVIKFRKVVEFIVLMFVAISLLSIAVNLNVWVALFVTTAIGGVATWWLFARQATRMRWNFTKSFGIALAVEFVFIIVNFGLTSKWW